MKTVLITGGNGLIGRKLTQKLIDEGYIVNWLSRSTKSGFPHKVYYWDINNEYIDKEAIQSADIIIHLAGASIADKFWTNTRRNELYNSRVKSALLLLRTCMDTGKFPEKFISASAIGYYGHRPGIELTEQSGPGDGYLSRLCIRWEDAADGFMCHNVSVTKIRVGIVLANESGSLPVFRRMSKFPILPLPGNGRQHLSWVHIDDLVNIFYEAVKNPALIGVANATSPDSPTLRTLLKSVAKAEKQHTLLFPTPALPLRLAMGDMAELFLSDALVSPLKLTTLGFSFNFTKLDLALMQLKEID